MSKVIPQPYQIAAATTAVRNALNNYSRFESDMISDDVLMGVVTEALTAAYNATPPASQGVTNA
jgi:hypothetical protein